MSDSASSLTWRDSAPGASDHTRRPVGPRHRPGTGRSPLCHQQTLQVSQRGHLRCGGNHVKVSVWVSDGLKRWCSLMDRNRKKVHRSMKVRGKREHEMKNMKNHTPLLPMISLHPFLSCFSSTVWWFLSSCLCRCVCEAPDGLTKARRRTASLQDWSTFTSFHKWHLEQQARTEDADLFPDFSNSSFLPSCSLRWKKWGRLCQNKLQKRRRQRFFKADELLN